MSMSIKLIPVETWLHTIGLLEYKELFSRYTGIELLLYVREGELRDMGVLNGGHRARMISSLTILRSKFEGKTQSSPRHSGSFVSSSSPPTLASHPDYAFANVSAEQLKADLEKELRMDSNDIRSHAWFHGAIPRQLAEKYVLNEGDFLVRESTSQPGNFVLTCFSKGIPLHFVVNKTVHQTIKYTSLLYQFETETFNSIPDLVRFYVGNRQPITAASRCVISNPINRTIPLSYYNDKSKMAGGTEISRRHSAIYMPVHSPKGSSPHASPTGSPAGTPRTRSPQLERKVVHRRGGSQPILSMDGSAWIEPPGLGHHGSLPSIDLVGQQKKTPVDQCKTTAAHMHQRTGSEPLLMPHTSPHVPPASRDIQRVPSPGVGALFGSAGNLAKSAGPPKPSRVPSIVHGQRPNIQIRNKALYDDNDQGDYSDYDQVKATPKSREYYREDIIYDTSPDYQLSVAMANLSQSSSNRSSLTEGIYDNNFNAKFTLGGDEDYDTPTSNKPIANMRKALSNENILRRDDSGYGTLKTDTDDLTEKEYMDKSRRRTISIPSIVPVNEFNPNFDVETFSSEILPPENKPLETTVMLTVKSIILESNPILLAKCITKLDLELLRVVGDHDLGVEVHSGLEIITLPQGKQLRQDMLERYNCLKMFVVVTILTCTKVQDRSRMLEQWIEVAKEMRTSMGNLYAFSAIMDALGSVQITRLKSTWMTLRQNYTKSAFMFDSKLKNLMKSLNEGTGTLPLQNISIPYVVPLVQLMERTSPDEISHWEKTDVDFGIEIMLAHLDVARIVAEQCGLYRIKGDEIVNGFQPEDRVLDVFRTELHLKLLWGSKGAGVNSRDRYSKFIQLLNILSEKVEPFNMNIGTEL